jgi:hypothetical protein
MSTALVCIARSRAETYRSRIVDTAYKRFVAIRDVFNVKGSLCFLLLLLLFFLRFCGLRVMVMVHTTPLLLPDR